MEDKIFKSHKGKEKDLKGRDVGRETKDTEDHFPRTFLLSSICTTPYLSIVLPYSPLWVNREPVIPDRY